MKEAREPESELDTSAQEEALTFSMFATTTTTTKNRSPVTFASLTPNNLGTVRKLNSVIFPVRYSDKFYADILLPEVEDFCQLGAGSPAIADVALI